MCVFIRVHILCVYERSRVKCVKWRWWEQGRRRKGFVEHSMLVWKHERNFSSLSWTFVVMRPLFAPMQLRHWLRVYLFCVYSTARNHKCYILRDLINNIFLLVWCIVVVLKIVRNEHKRSPKSTLSIFFFRANNRNLSIVVWIWTVHTGKND